MFRWTDIQADVNVDKDGQIFAHTDTCTDRHKDTRMGR